jgi:hypothetical protein
MHRRRRTPPFISCALRSANLRLSPLVAASVIVVVMLMGRVANAQTAAPNPGISLSPNCPSSNAGYCYQTPADTQQVVDCAWTSGSPTVTCASSHFTSLDVGKRAFGYTNCAAFANFSAASGSITDSTAVTISAVASASSVTLSANALNTQSTQAGCFIWGDPDDTAAAAVDSLLAGSYSALPFCPTINLMAAQYMFTTPHFFTNPTACLNAGAVYYPAGGIGDYANVFYHAGLEVRGQGAGTTVVYVTPGFPETGTCTNSVDNDSCFSIPLSGRWSDFQINGAWNPNPANIPVNTVLINQRGPSSLERFQCVNWGGNKNVIGIRSTVWAVINQVNNSGCGGIGFEAGDAQSMQVTAFRFHVENSTISAAKMNGSVSAAIFGFSCYECAFAEGQNAATNSVIFDNPYGTSVYLNNTQIESANSTSGVVGYKAETTANSALTLEESRVHTAGGDAIVCSVMCTIFAHNNYIVTPNNYYSDVAAASFRDQGGNNFTGGGTFNITGQILSVANLVGSGTIPIRGGAQTLCALGAQTPITGNGGNQNVFTCPIPASLFQAPVTGQPGHAFTAVFAFRQSTGSGTITYQPKLGGSVVANIFTSASTTPIRIAVTCVVTGTNAEVCSTAGAVTGSAFIASSQQNFSPTETTGSASSISITFNVANTSAVTPALEMVTAQ